MYISSNRNFEMFYCEIMVLIGFQQYTLHVFLNTDCQYNRKLALACCLKTIPNKRTFDRRLKTISIDVKNRISSMGCLFIVDGMVVFSITEQQIVLF